MFETRLTVVGTVTSEVRLTHTRSGGIPVANFTIATTARTFSKEKSGWVDGNSLFLRVSCWRRLGENVAASVHRGDPVLVSGNLSSRSYETSEGNRRWSYQLDAANVGPDLSRGTATFARRATQQGEQPDSTTVLAAGPTAVDELGPARPPLSEAA